LLDAIDFAITGTINKFAVKEARGGGWWTSPRQSKRRRRSGKADFLGGGMPNIRKAAAYTYQALLDLGSKRLGVPKDQLSVKDGVVSGNGKSMSYGELVKGQQLKLTIPVKGNLTDLMGLTVTGDPPMKPVSEYTVIGKSYRNAVIPSKVAAREKWATDVRLAHLHKVLTHRFQLLNVICSHRWFSLLFCDWSFS
jgi:hypothetical protein